MIVIDLETGQTKENISVTFYRNPKLQQMPWEVEPLQSN
jgi:hypothetical protein